MTLELVSEVCDVCDQSGGLETFHGVPMHSYCAPSHWRKDREDRVEFLAEVERRANK